MIIKLLAVAVVVIVMITRIGIVSRHFLERHPAVNFFLQLNGNKFSVTHSCYIDEILNSLFLTLVRLHVSA
jgi:hypothetical protein